MTISFLSGYTFFNSSTMMVIIILVVLIVDNIKNIEDEEIKIYDGKRKDTDIWKK